MIFIVKNAGPLKDFLADHLPLSRTKIKQLLDARKVFVNNSRVWIAGYQLKKGDKVEVIGDLHTPNPAAGTPSPSRGKGLGVRGINLPVLYEDDYYLIINKPTGLLTNGKNSAEELLQKQYNDRNIVAVHRLDRDTTGLVIFAKKTEYFQKIKEIFRQNKITKIYRVLVQGQVKTPEFIINKPIDGQPAVSKMRVLAANAQASYLEVKIDTGRTHQIRIHLAGYGHPVIGDNRYALNPLRDALLRRAPHQMLHAYRLEFDHPYLNKRVSATEKENANFQQLLRVLRLK